MRIEVSELIVWLQCSACGAEFPTLVFSGENDCVTAGLRTRTDLANKVLYAYDHADDGPVGAEVEFLRTEDLEPQPGESFQEFYERSENIESRNFYKCLLCGGEFAEQMSQLSTSELESKGYKYVDLVK